VLKAKKKLREFKPTAATSGARDTQVQLRVISVGLEVNIMCLDYICKVRRV